MDSIRRRITSGRVFSPLAYALISGGQSDLTSRQFKYSMTVLRPPTWLWKLSKSTRVMMHDHSSPACIFTPTSQ